MNPKVLTATGNSMKSSFTPVESQLLQRKCACGGSGGLTGDCEGCSNARLKLQRDVADHVEPSTGPPIVHEVLRAPGQPLDSATRAFFEPRFGHDFSQVRVHADAKAVESARAVNALAYTVGRDIVFGQGQFAPRATSGQHLLAHELAHVVQQGGQPASQQTNLEVGEPQDRFEKEADDVAEAIMAINSGFQLSIAGPNGTAAEDEPYQQRIEFEGQSGLVTRAPMPELRTSVSLRRTPTIQRAASFAAGAVHSVWNLAQTLAAGRMQGGFTPPMLNGTQILSAATAMSSINRPVLGGRSTATGVECWVNSVGNNVGSFDMTLPAAGPWTTTTPKIGVAGLVGSPACVAAGDTSFSVHGLPTDADFLTRATAHEQHHAADHESVFNAIAVPWDNALTAAAAAPQTAGNIFSGADVTPCEASLYSAMGGTPDAIATNLHNSWIAANNAFHASPTGHAASLSGGTADATCSVSSVDVQV